MQGKLKLLCAALALCAAACRADSKPELATSASPSASAAPRVSGSVAGAAAFAPEARLQELLAAEHRRDSRAVLADDAWQRDVRVRRAAARALARIADARARDALKRSLADEDSEVVTWSAYGLGYACREGEVEVVRALTMRAAALMAEPARTASKVSALDPLGAITDALGRCGTGDAERALRAWLTGDKPLAESAALALGRIASQKGRLDDTSMVLLLDAASRPSAELDHALFAFTRLSGLGGPVQTRLLDVARKNASATGVRRTLALRALASAGDEAAPALAEGLQNTQLSAAERAEAARSLGRLGAAGQTALRQSLLALASADKPLATGGPELGPWTALLDSLQPPVSDAAAALGRIAELALPESPVERRRVVALRCRAAALLAGRATLSPRLRACDPDPHGRAGKLATLFVLDQGQLTGARHARFRELAQDADPVVRQQALRLLGGHPEAPGAPELLAQALRSKTTGEVATAAGVLSRYPERAGGDGAALTPHPNVIAALGAAFDSTAQGDELETHAALMDAAAALQLLGFKGRIEKSCSSERPSLREHAQKALRLFGDRQRNCNEFEPAKIAVAELGRLVSRPSTLELDTDIGLLTLELDATLAPVAATRVLELAQQGFYDGMAVHRVVPGFVVQFGDRVGDGFGGAGRPALRCETAPVPFAELAVGMALGGRDTGSSQLFVALGRFPHLDGEYTVVGRAQGPWQAVAEGDVIRKVRVNAPR